MRQLLREMTPLYDRPIATAGPQKAAPTADTQPKTENYAEYNIDKLIELAGKEVDKKDFKKAKLIIAYAALKIADIKIGLNNLGKYDKYVTDVNMLQKFKQEKIDNKVLPNNDDFKNLAKEINDYLAIFKDLDTDSAKSLLIKYTALKNEITVDYQNAIHTANSQQATDVEDYYKNDFLKLVENDISAVKIIANKTITSNQETEKVAITSNQETEKVAITSNQETKKVAITSTQNEQQKLNEITKTAETLTQARTDLKRAKKINQEQKNNANILEKNNKEIAKKEKEIAEKEKAGLDASEEKKSLNELKSLDAQIKTKIRENDKTLSALLTRNAGKPGFDELANSYNQTLHDLEKIDSSFKDLRVSFENLAQSLNINLKPITNNQQPTTTQANSPTNPLENYYTELTPFYKEIAQAGNESAVFNELNNARKEAIAEDKKAEQLSDEKKMAAKKEAARKLEEKTEAAKKELQALGNKYSKLYQNMKQSADNLKAKFKNPETSPEEKKVILRQILVLERSMKSAKRVVLGVKKIIENIDTKKVKSQDTFNLLKATFSEVKKIKAIMIVNAAPQTSSNENINKAKQTLKQEYDSKATNLIKTMKSGAPEQQKQAESQLQALDQQYAAKMQAVNNLEQQVVKLQKTIEDFQQNVQKTEVNTKVTDALVKLQDTVNSAVLELVKDEKDMVVVTNILKNLNDKEFLKKLMEYQTKEAQQNQNAQSKTQISSTLNQIKSLINNLKGASNQQGKMAVRDQLKSMNYKLMVQAFLVSIEDVQADFKPNESTRNLTDKDILLLGKIIDAIEEEEFTGKQSKENLKEGLSLLSAMVKNDPAILQQIKDLFTDENGQITKSPEAIKQHMIQVILSNLDSIPLDQLKQIAEKIDIAEIKDAIEKILEKNGMSLDD